MWCFHLLRKDFENILHLHLSNLFLERDLKIHAYKLGAFVGAKRRKIEHTSHGRKVGFPKGSSKANCSYKSVALAFFEPKHLLELETALGVVLQRFGS
jgi:hypothetical protein